MAPQLQFYCPDCGIETPENGKCPACGDAMKVTLVGTPFMVEVIDIRVSRKVKDLTVYERRGPFQNLTEALYWWSTHEHKPRYIGCVGCFNPLQPPNESENNVI